MQHFADSLPFFKKLCFLRGSFWAIFPSKIFLSIIQFLRAMKFIVGKKPLLKGGRNFQKLSHWGRVQNFFLEKGGKPEKECRCRSAGAATFFTTVQFSSITFTVCGEKVRFLLLLFGLSVFWVNHSRFSFTFSSKFCTNTCYHLYISDPFW